MRALCILLAFFAGTALASWTADSTHITADRTDATADGFVPAPSTPPLTSSKKIRLTVALAIGVYT